MAKEIFVPRLGANDEKVTMAEWLVGDGEFIKVNQPICQVETSKAIFEVESPYEGYIKILAKIDTEISFDRCIAFVLDTLDENLDTQKYLKIDEPKIETEAEKKAKHYTKKAYEYAIRNSCNIDVINKKGIITVKDVKEYLERERNLPEPVLDIKQPLLHKQKGRGQKASRSIAIYGTGLGALMVKQYIDEEKKYKVKYFINDFIVTDVLYGIPVIKITDLARISKELFGVACFVANNEFRLKIKAILEGLGLEPISVISPRASIRRSSHLDKGVLVKDGAVIDVDCKIGSCCIIDNNVTLAHHCILEEGCFLAPGVTVGGGTKIGEKTILAIGSNVVSKITIGKNVIISAGSSVHTDVPDNCVVEGCPGRIIGRTK